MKASELIIALQEMVNEHGDMEVYSESCGVSPHLDTCYGKPCIELH